MGRLTRAETEDKHSTSSFLEQSSKQALLSDLCALGVNVQVLQYATESQLLGFHKGLNKIMERKYERRDGLRSRAQATILSMLTLAAAIISIISVTPAYAQGNQRERFVIFLGYTDKEMTKWRALYDRTFTNLPSEYSSMLKGVNVQFVSAPQAKDLLMAYQHTLPQLRASHPKAVFVFVVKPEMKRDFQLVGSIGYGGTSYISRAEGATFVDKGVAIVLQDQAVISTIQHELMHLIDCGTWHDSNGRTLPNGKIIKYPGAASLPWCTN